MLVHCLDRLFSSTKKGAFRHLKKQFSEEVDREESLVARLTASLTRLQHLHTLKYKSRLWKSLTLWRIHTIQLSQQECSNLHAYALTFYKQILPTMVRSWQSGQGTWVTTVSKKLEELGQVFGCGAGMLVEFVSKALDSSLVYSKISRTE
jgi:hypothetical protein